VQAGLPPLAVSTMPAKPEQASTPASSMGARALVGKDWKPGADVPRREDHEAGLAQVVNPWRLLPDSRQ
jgi:hypothetical protein